MPKKNAFKIKTGVIGVGYRGRYLLELMLKSDLFEIIAVADPSDELSSRMTPLFDKEKGVPELFDAGKEDYLNMLAAHSFDLVVIASPWECHQPQALAVLDAGSHVALEIKGALARDEYSELAKRSVDTGLSVFPLENSFFMRDVMAVYCMVMQGVLGEIVFCQGGYRHDLRKLLVDGLGNFGETEYTESVWRSPFYEQYNGDLYPTHGIAPLCMMLQINRSNRFTEFTAFATKGAGIKAAIRRNGGEAHPDLNRSFATGDVITSIIKTETGAQITLLHDTTLPRPRSLNFEIQGTKGIWNGDLHSIYIEGLSPLEQWESDQRYIEQYEHPFWKQWGNEALTYDRHHNGMDYIMLRALAEEFAEKGTYPFGLDDLAVWASVTPLSIRSIAEQRTIKIETN